MDLFIDNRNFLELTRAQRNMVLRMCRAVWGRNVVWDADSDIILPEAIRFRQENRLHVFPHMEFDEWLEQEPPTPPGTPDITE